MTADEEAALSDLGYHWGDYYDLSVTRAGWRASPIRDSSAVITASTAAKLGELLALDFADRHPLPGFCGLSDRMST